MTKANGGPFQTPTEVTLKWPVILHFFGTLIFSYSTNSVKQRSFLWWFTTSPQANNAACCAYTYMWCFCIIFQITRLKKKKMFQKDSIVIHDQWEPSWAWPGLMQLISIFITPTSCAYDILDLPRHAKSTLSLYCCFSLRHSPSLSAFCLCISLFSSLCSCSISPSSPSVSLGSTATLPWHPAWVLSVCQSVCLWTWGQSKSVEANVRRLWHYITWQRSPS